MSYNLSISGHKDVANADEGEAFEKEIAKQARAFVASLEGVSSATGSFAVIGSQNLKETQ